jgi:hypothetical protein
MPPTRMPNLVEASPLSDTRWSRRGTLAMAVVLLTLTSACSKDDSPTAPTDTSTSTVAAPTISESFAGTLPVGGARFYAFTVVEYGTVNVTLTSVGGPNVPSTLWLGLGIGTPTAQECTTSTAVNTQSGSSPQVTGTYAPGIYCARVTDIGNLVAPAAFAVTIDHP